MSLSNFRPVEKIALDDPSQDDERQTNAASPKEETPSPRQGTNKDATTRACCQLQFSVTAQCRRIQRSLLDTETCVDSMLDTRHSHQIFPSAHMTKKKATCSTRGIKRKSNNSTLNMVQHPQLQHQQLTMMSADPSDVRRSVNKKQLFCTTTNGNDNCKNINKTNKADDNNSQLHNQRWWLFLLKAKKLWSKATHQKTTHLNGMIAIFCGIQHNIFSYAF